MQSWRANPTESAEPRPRGSQMTDVKPEDNVIKAAQGYLHLTCDLMHCQILLGAQTAVTSWYVSNSAFCLSRVAANESAIVGCQTDHVSPLRTFYSKLSLRVNFLTRECVMNINLYKHRCKHF